MNKSITFSVKSLLVSLLVIIIAVAGYFAVPVIIPSHSIVGKTFIKHNDNPNAMTGVISFSEDGTARAYSIMSNGQKTRKMKLVYHLEGNVLIIAMPGFFKETTTIKWLNKTTFKLTYNNGKVEIFGEEGGEYYEGE